MKVILSLVFLLLLVSNTTGQTQDNKDEKPALYILSQKHHLIAIFSNPTQSRVVEITPTDTAPPIYQAPKNVSIPITNPTNSSSRPTQTINIPANTVGMDRTINRPSNTEAIGGNNQKGITGYHFLAIIEVRNAFDKSIKSVKWEIHIREMETGKTIHAFKFKNKYKISPKTILKLSNSKKVPKDFELPKSYTKLAFVSEIEFSDGTKWLSSQENK